MHPPAGQGTLSQRMSYQRVLLKLSGEALGDPESGHGIDPGAVEGIARQVARVARLGVETALVVGGGNILRGATFSESGAHRASAGLPGIGGCVSMGGGVAGPVVRASTGAPSEVNSHSKPVLALAIRAISNTWPTRIDTGPSPCGRTSPSSAKVAGGGALPMAGPLAQAHSNTHRPGSSSSRMVASSLETPPLYTPALGPVRKMAA